MSDKLVIRSRLKDYEVKFVNDFAETLRPQVSRDVFLVIDQRVMELYRGRVQHLLPENHVVIVEAIEFNKTVDYCQKLIRTLIENNIRRGSTLIAIGGGITQDITGFVSSILFRGINWIFYPTTLLAQADSCIGSKTSINLGEYKNLLGSFYPPSEVIIDVNFLETLLADDIKSGIGEILHFYLIAGNELAERLVDNYDELFAYPKLLKDYIPISLNIKKNVIEIDEFDENERKLFNYGHTFGHAIETVSGYRVNHGQAVTMGMDIANYISLNLGYLDKQTFESMHRILAENMPAFRLQKDKLADYFTALSKDKKNIGNNLGCILTSGPGSMRKTQIPLDDKLKRMILSYFNR